jgi:hypothetical protein
MISRPTSIIAGAPTAHRYFGRMRDVTRARTLIITGAGASAGLGRDDIAMPLMADWAHRLREEIGAELTEMSTLNHAQTGPEFEETLGALFRFAESLEDANRFAGMARQPPGHDHAWQNTLRQALGFGRANLDRFMERLHHSLFANFGPDRINVGSAHAAYYDLFERLDLTIGKDQLIVATTNYDRSIELAFGAASVPLRTGFSSDGVHTPLLNADGLGTFRSEQPSVLYLHGAVGWYRRANGIIRMPADAGYQDIHGAPAVLYPGPDKDIGRVETRELWDEFATAAAEADRILVLGHSLHDDHLVSVLRDVSAPLAVTYYSLQQPSASASEIAVREEQRIADLLPEATPIAASFGPSSSFDMDTLHGWLAHAEHLAA